MLIVDFDASTTFSDGQNRSGIGYVIRDTKGLIIKKGCRSIKTVEPNKAEWISLLSVSEVLKELNPKGMIIIRGDNESVITQIKKYYDNNIEEENRTKYAHLIKKIISNLKSISKLHPRFYWISRNKNKRADKMAGLASGKYTKFNYKKEKHRAKPNSKKRRYNFTGLSDQATTPSEYTYDI